MEKGTFSALCATVPKWDGKAAERAGESEDLPECEAKPSWPGVPCLDLEDKKGKSPDRFFSVRGFLFSGP
jgi:hypothetical protein